jgi:hypothetical protein
MAKHDDRSRRRAARNGADLSPHATYNVMNTVKDLVDGLHKAAVDLERMRRMRGSRAWRRDCLTPDQRAAVRLATRLVRDEASKWRK